MPSRFRRRQVCPSFHRVSIVGGYPDAAIRGREHGLGVITGGTLCNKKRGHGQLSKAVQSFVAGEPDVAFAIFEKTAGDVARETDSLLERVRPAILHMKESSPVGPDPDAAFAVPQQLVGFDDVVGTRSDGLTALRMGRIRFVADESFEPRATEADQELSIGRS